MMSAPRKLARKARPAGPLSPVKRAHGGKATSSVGLARSMGCNYKRFVMFENRAGYLAATPPRTPRGTPLILALALSELFLILTSACHEQGRACDVIFDTITAC
jgi:hypothetical protein